MSESYELPFDEEAGKFKSETIRADVLRTGFEGSCEIETADFEYDENTLNLQTAFASGDTEVPVEVSLLDEVYESSDFLSIIDQEFDVKFSLVPREYDAAGQYKLAPAVSDSCIVKCADVTLRGRLEEPTREELPIPALGDESIELLIKVTLGKGNKPRPGLRMSWERSEEGCANSGKLEGISDETDEEGEFRLSYTAPELYYRPGGKFFEEYRFFSESKGGRREVFRLKLPLAPWLVFRMKAEKKAVLNEVEYGLDSELSPIVEINPRERLKVLEAQPLLKAVAGGEERKFPIREADFQLLLGDENGVDEEQEGIHLKSNSEGKLHWEIPELKEAFGDLGRTYSLSEDRGELPEIALTEAAEKAVGFFESSWSRSPVPAEVFSGDLGRRIETYRFVHSEQLAREETRAYEKIRSSMEFLGIGVRYVIPFNRAFSEQFAPLLGVLGDTFWDVFNIGWNVGNFAGKIFEALGKVGESIAKGIVSRLKASPGFFSALLSKLKTVSWALEKVAGGVSWLGSKISAFAGFVAKYVPGLKSMAGNLGKEIREILALWPEIQKQGMQKMAGLVVLIKRLLMAVVDALRALFDCVAALMKKLAFWLISNVAVGLKMMQENYLSLLRNYVNVESLEKALRIIFQAFGKPEAFNALWQTIFVQLGNLLQGKVEEFLGKGNWTGAAADRSVSGFANLKLFNPSAKAAIEQLYLSCKNLDVGLDYETKRKGATRVAGGMKDIQLQYELDFIYREATRTFIGSMKIPVEIALGVVMFIFSLGTGVGLYMELCTALEVALSSLSIWFINVPHAVGIFIGAYVILHAYLSVVTGLEH